jgi:hypothetical protein
MGLNTNIAVGYIIEASIMGSVPLGTFFLCIFQIFHIWKLPHNKNRIKVLQKAFLYPGTINAFVYSVICVDQRAVSGIWDIRVVAGGIVIVTAVLLSGMLFYHQSLVTIVKDAGLGHNYLQAFSSKFEIRICHTVIVMSMYIAAAVSLFVLTCITDLLWSQYRYVETLQEPAHVLLEDNSTLRHSDSSSITITTENDLVQKGNQLKFEKMREREREPRVIFILN